MGKTTETSFLTVPDQFRRTALAFPDMVKQAIAKIKKPTIAADGLAKSQALADYAKRIKATAEEVNSIQYGKLLLAAKVGELCPKEQGKRTDLTSHPAREKLFHANTLTDYRKLTKHQREGKIDDYWKAAVDAGHDSVEMSIAGFLNYVGSGGVIATRHGGGVVAWYTPERYLELSRAVMGSIDCDPASSKVAQKTVKAKVYYTEADDGLQQQWQGNVFLNPPFKMPLVARFVAKLCQEIEASNTKQAVLLTNSNTDTDWWQQAATAATVVCLTDGRISFYNEAGDWSSPTNGQSFMYFGEKRNEFETEFRSVGICFRQRKSR